MKMRLSMATLALSLSLGATVHPQSGTTVRALAANRGLLFGTAVQGGNLPNPNVPNSVGADGGQYAGFVKGQFNMIEPENDFKPPAVWKGPTTYDFGATDAVTTWAQTNNLTMRAHTLIYARDDGWTLPNWLVDTTNPDRPVLQKYESNTTFTPAAAQDLLRQYITAIASRYQGKIAIWDVINESIDDTGANTNPYRLRNSFWYRKLGPNFIPLAFTYARAAAPNAKLYINDYGIEDGGAKGQNLLAMVLDLKKQGVPIDGIGMQWHVDAGQKIVAGDAYYQFAQSLKNNGVDIIVTEPDAGVPITIYDKTNPLYGQIPKNGLVDNAKTSTDPVTQAAFNSQATTYQQVLRYALSFNNCRGFNLWGFSDKYSWIPSFTGGRATPLGAALIADRFYQPKAAYSALQAELQQPVRKVHADLPFDANSGTFAQDVTQHGWNGTLSGGATWVAGKQGNAVNLNGTGQYVSFPTGVVNGLNDFSIGAWVYLNANRMWQRVFDFGSGSTGAYMFLTTQNDANKLRFAISTSGGAGEQQINATTGVATGGWHHVAVTKRGNVGTLYLDGISVGSNSAMTLSPSSLGATTQNWIGRSQYATDSFLNGRVDTFKIYDNGLSAEEVGTLVTPLAAPTGLTATPGNAQVTLRWNAVPRAASYTISRSTTNGGPYLPVATGVTDLTFTNPNLTNGKIYYYIVAPVNAAGQGRDSVQVGATPNVSSPTATSVKQS